MKTTKTTAKVKSLINGEVNSPLPISVIPNYMGINLVSVDSIEWEKRVDGQLVSLTINFIPNEDNN